QKQGQKDAETALKNWWTRMQQMFHSTTVVNATPQPGRMGGPQPYPGTTTTGRRGSRALGGGIPIGGDYLLHAGEHVLNSDESNFLTRMLGGAINLPRMQTALAGGGGGLQIGTYAPQH